MSPDSVESRPPAGRLGLKHNKVKRRPRVNQSQMLGRQEWRPTGPDSKPSFLAAPPLQWVISRGTAPADAVIGEMPGHSETGLLSGYSTLLQISIELVWEWRNATLLLGDGHESRPCIWICFPPAMVEQSPFSFVLQDWGDGETPRINLSIPVRAAASAASK